MRVLYKIILGFALIALIFAVFAAGADESVSLPDYGPQVFERAKQDPCFLATRGTLPEMVNDTEKIKWVNSLSNCISAPIPEMEQFSPQSGGHVTSYGYSDKGYIKIELFLDPSENISDSTIDEIYQVVENHCKNEGVNNVPVIFYRWQYVDEGPDTPGFSSTLLVLSLILLIRMRRR